MVYAWYKTFEQIHHNVNWKWLVDLSVGFTLCFQLKVNLRFTLFPIKDLLRFGMIYRYTCSNTKVTDYRKTFHHFYSRAAEHKGISNLTRKPHKNVKQSSIYDRLLQCNWTINFDDVDVTAADSNKFKLFLKESLLMRSDKLILNRTTKSFPLGIFDQLIKCQFAVI